jgi:hypothetical protein
MSILESVQESHLAGLQAMRDKLAADMDIAEPAVVAQIAGRLQAILDAIESVKRATPTQGSGLDELERKRAARQSNSQRRATPTRKRG